MKQLQALIDHTLLKADATNRQIMQLCNQAKKYRFKTVCINPTHIELAVQNLKGSKVGICTVVGFPLGASTSDTKLYEAEIAENLGATEIDMVVNVGAVKDGNLNLVKNDILNVRRGLSGASLLKVILECSLLTDEEIKTTARIAVDSGADFVKTSTGFNGGATTEQVTLLFDTVGRKAGIKAAGGIRDLKTALAMVEAGASRIGTSSGVPIIEDYLNGSGL